MAMLGLGLKAGKELRLERLGLRRLYIIYNYIYIYIYI